MTYPTKIVFFSRSRIDLEVNYKSGNKQLLYVEKFNVNMDGADLTDVEWKTIDGGACVIFLGISNIESIFILSQHIHIFTLIRSWFTNDK